MNKFYKTNLEEQETIINVDHFNKNAHCYTSRYATYNRLIKKLGEPNKTYYTDKKISGASWIVPLSDKKKIAVIFSRTIILGNIK